MLQQVWNLDYKSQTNALPFAGSKQKVMIVNHKQGNIQNNHRDVFGGNKVPFGVFDEKSNYQTTSNNFSNY
jgi:hypothetical protein